MDVSYLKVQIGESKPIISYFPTPDFSEAKSLFSGIQSDDLVVLSHLQPYFPCTSLLNSVLESPTLSTGDISTNFVGRILTNELNPEIPPSVDSVVCFDEVEVKGFLKNSILKMNPEVWISLGAANISELSDLVFDATGFRVYFGSKKQTSFKILRLSDGDIEQIAPKMPRGVSSESRRFEQDNPVDAFDLVKSRLVNSTPTLESRGFEVAEYIAEGDYIQMYSDIIMSRVDPDIEEVVCNTTELSFTPRVTIPEGKTFAILRASLYVNGVSVFMTEAGNRWVDISFELNEYNQDENNPYKIANDIFLYSGVDLMRQRYVDKHFEYSPHEFFEPEGNITIRGREKDAVGDRDGHYIPAPAVLTFMLIDDLPSDSIDFTREQWGEEKTILSCSEYISTAS